MTLILKKKLTYYGGIGSIILSTLLLSIFSIHYYEGASSKYTKQIEQLKVSETLVLKVQYSF